MDLTSRSLVRGPAEPFMDEEAHTGAVRGRRALEGLFTSMAPTWLHSRQRFIVKPGQEPGNLNFKSYPK